MPARDLPPDRIDDPEKIFSSLGAVISAHEMQVRMLKPGHGKTIIRSIDLNSAKRNPAKPRPVAVGNGPPVVPPSSRKRWRLVDGCASRSLLEDVERDIIER